MSQAPQRAKFRWTERLTCRFIQLRRENRKLFTGRKYSAQAGWECILEQMLHEFPTIMAGVHYKVLKKKWSNLLQQYKSDLLKELKNPVHGDRNEADDVSWPFYTAIEEILVHGAATPSSQLYIDPHEFLCVSVTPEEATSSSSDALPPESNPEVETESWRPFLPGPRLRSIADQQCSSIEIERVPRTHVAPRYNQYCPHESTIPNATEHCRNVLCLQQCETKFLVHSCPGYTVLLAFQGARQGSYMLVLALWVPFWAELSTAVYYYFRQISKGHVKRKRDTASSGISRSPRASDLPIEKVTSAPDAGKELSRIARSSAVDSSRNKGQAATTRNEDEERPRKRRRTRGPCHESHESRIDRRIDQIFEYTKRRDQENRSIMMRILHAVETIANKL